MVMTKDSIPVITIDGPAGSGKGTVAKQLATNLKYHYLDSGALYRILGLLSKQRGIEVDDVQSLVALCKEMDVRFGFDAQNLDSVGNVTRQESEQEKPLQEHVPVFLNNREVSHDLRTEECAAQASQLASVPEVRAALLEKQRSFLESPGLVAEGRDMGTVVFPNGASLGPLLKDIETRDSRDQDRKVSPLRPADDAVLVDSTNLSIEQVVNHINELLHGGH